MKNWRVNRLTTKEPNYGSMHCQRVQEEEAQGKHGGVEAAGGFGWGNEAEQDGKCGEQNGVAGEGAAATTGNEKVRGKEQGAVEAEDPRDAATGEAAELGLEGGGEAHGEELTFLKSLLKTRAATRRMAPAMRGMIADDLSTV